jgi:hypothetical protein
VIWEYFDLKIDNKSSLDSKMRQKGGISQQPKLQQAVRSVDKESLTGC